MKTLVQLMVLTMIIVVPCKSKSQQWTWSSNFIKASANGTTEGEFKMAKDAADDMFISGGYNGPVLLTGNNWISSQSQVLMVSKVGPYGQLYWTDTVGVGLAGHDVCADGNGGCYSAFNFYNQAWVDSILLTPGLTQNSSSALVHYNANGKAMWAATSAGKYYTATTSVSSDTDQNIYLTGLFNDTVSFNGIQLISKGLADIFIVKYNSNGNVLWAKSFGTDQNETPNNIHVGADGFVYLTGNFKNNIQFGSVTLNGGGVNPPSFLTKFTNDGNTVWSKAFITIETSNTASHNIHDLKERDGKVYVLGNFSNRLEVDSMQYALETNHLQKMFLMGFDENGHLCFEKHSSGTDDQTAASMDFDSKGNIFVAGTAAGDTALFDDKYLIVPYGKSIPYIVAYNELGEINMLQTATFTNAGAGNCNQIVVTSDGSCIAMGDYVYDIKFGITTALTNYPTYHSNVYLAGLDVSTVSVDKTIVKDVDIKLFPNPITTNNSTLNIVSENPIDEINIYDVLGHVIYSGKNLDIEAAIDLSGKGAGIYFTEIKSGDVIVTKKIIVN